MKKVLSTILLALFVYIATPAQVFKVPKDVFTLDSTKTGFHGMFMLHKDKPIGVFIAYPDKDETMEQVRARIATYIVPMFFHVKEGEKFSLPEAQTSQLPGHDGDAGTAGLSNLFSSEVGQIGMVFYVRDGGGRLYTYGYFSYVKKGDKPEDKYWGDQKGNGSKLFEEFRKTLTP
jgi:hypothetical protein